MGSSVSSTIIEKIYENKFEEVEKFWKIFWHSGKIIEGKKMGKKLVTQQQILVLKM